MTIPLLCAILFNCPAPGCYPNRAVCAAIVNHCGKSMKNKQVPKSQEHSTYGCTEKIFRAIRGKK